MDYTSQDYVLTSGICEIMPVVIPLLYFLFKNRKRSVPVTLAGIALYFAASIPIAWLFTPFWSHDMMSRYIFSLSYLVLGSLLFPVFIDERYEVCLFVALLMRNYTDLCRLFAGILYYYMFRHAPEHLFAEPGVILLVAAVSLITAPMFIKYLNITRDYGLRTRDLHFWRYLWLVPLMFYAMFRLAVYPDFLYISSSKSGTQLLFPIAYMISLFLNYVILLQMMNALTGREDAYKQLRTTEAVISIQRSANQTLIRNMEEIAKLRHDLRHHIIAIDALAKQGDAGRIEEYIAPLMEFPIMSDPLVFCPSPTVNAIISYYHDQAKEAGAAFNCRVDLPGTFDMPELDLCSILGTLLQNAVEACQRQTSGERSIRVVIGMSGDSMILIRVENTYDHEIRQKDGDFISSKTSGPGIGTSSVRHLTEEYHGVCKFTWENGIFAASVLLNPALNTAGDDRA